MYFPDDIERYIWEFVRKDMKSNHKKLLNYHKSLWKNVHLNLKTIYVVTDINIITTFQRISYLDSLKACRKFNFDVVDALMHVFMER